jgi:hypothetical protein
VAPVNKETGPPANLALPSGVEKLCSIQFNKDEKRHARVEDNVLPCLDKAAAVLKQRPDRKLVLVGVSDPVKDHEEKDTGEERDGEDMTGLDIRYEDTSAYRVVNTKDYLTRYYHILPSRILPTTNENRHGQGIRILSFTAQSNIRLARTRCVSLRRKSLSRGTCTFHRPI